jgi:hypothetical protein
MLLADCSGSLAPRRPPRSGLEPFEVTVLAPLIFSPHCLEERLRLAYLRRNPGWLLAFPRSRVWAIAAANLLHAHQADPDLPLDPELFIASQPSRPGLADPWGDLTRPGSIERYRSRVRKLVGRLRRELRTEIRWARRRLDKGVALETVLAARNLSLTPLVRYILAMQEMREDLAAHFVEPALRQHDNCPLYKLACEGMLPTSTYPADLALDPDGPTPSETFAFSVN